MANRSQTLFDVITRQQIYIEGLKEFQQQDAARHFAAMEVEVRAAVAGLPVEAVGDLTQAQIRALLRQLKAILTRFYDATLKRLVAFLSDWLVYEVKETPRLLSDDSNPVVPLASASSLWAAISSEPMGATGGTILSLLGALSPAAVREVAARVRGGVTDNMSIRELLAALVGTPSLRNRDGVLNRHRNNMSSAIATAVQHVASQVRDRAYGLLTNRYMWNSVIDGQTTDVCKRRNGRTFIRGEGPLPPAHYNCRSSTIPIFLNETVELPRSYYRWVTTQPEPFVRDILPRRIHEVLKRGDLRADDLPKFSNPAPLTLDEYKTKTNLIKTGTDG